MKKPQRSKSEPIDRLANRLSLGLFCLIVLLAAALRLHDLDRLALRGDEAFAVRYWAAPPAQILDPQSGLAWVEPHPFGTYFAFWLWKSLAGQTEFAMRMLPALVNLLGVAAMFALGRRLFGSRWVALAGALLWAINPNLIWHSQDVRNYALWAGMSAVSLWLLVRAADRRTRLDWVLYVLAEALTLYMFFLEAFMLVAQGLYVLASRRRALRGWLVSLAMLAVLLLPWFGQAAALAGSGYGGTRPGGDEGLPITILGFWVRLLTGELPGAGSSSLLAAVVAFSLPLYGLVLFWVAGFIETLLRLPRAVALVGLYVVVPTGLLLLAATRLAVFDERYLMGITPALLLPYAVVLGGLFRVPGEAARRLSAAYVVAALLLALIYGWLASASLTHYYNPAYHKSPDWYALRDYLRQHAAPDDLLIVSPDDPTSGVIDPAYAYYWPGPLLILPYPGADTERFVQDGLSEHRAVWFAPKGATADEVQAALERYGTQVSEASTGRDFQVLEYQRR